MKINNENNSALLYGNGHNWSMHMVRHSGIEPGTIRPKYVSDRKARPGGFYSRMDNS